MSDQPTQAFEPLWTQKEAAAYLRVSAEYLRSSDCPKVILPSPRGAGKRPLIRYQPQAVREWAIGYEARRRKLKVS